MDKTLIIAEIGECFNGEMDRAEKLILVTKEAGCDIAKFQTLDYENTSEDDPEASWFKKIALDPEKIAYLIRYANKIGIGILFSPENIKTARWLIDAGLEDVKIASSTIIDVDFLDFVNNNFNRVFISTGMASLDEVKAAVDSLNKIGELFIMHCISEYPTGPLLDSRGLKTMSHNDVRLNMMRMLMKLFPGKKIGYSDHTSGILASVVAVAMGARIIEKHITLDRKIPIENFKAGKEYLGTDHVLSAEPAELKEMVKLIRQTEEIIGEEKWERTKGEKVLMDFLRKRFSK